MVPPDILSWDVEEWTLDNGVEEIFQKESPCNQITESHFDVLMPHGADFETSYETCRSLGGEMSTFGSRNELTSFSSYLISVLNKSTCNSFLSILMVSEE